MGAGRGRRAAAVQAPPHRFEIQWWTGGDAGVRNAWECLSDDDAGDVERHCALLDRREGVFVRLTRAGDLAFFCCCLLLSVASADCWCLFAVRDETMPHTQIAAAVVSSGCRAGRRR